MSDLFRFVLVGSGNISRTYVNAMDNIAEGAIVGLVTRSGRKPEYLPGEVEVAEELPAITTPYDGVILCTPNGLHHQGAIAAAGLGKHVLTEKPLDITASNMEDILAACSEANVKLGVTYQHRMSPDNRTLKQLIDLEAFGRIYSADYVVRCWRDQAYYDSGEWRGSWKLDGGGPFMQQACHELDLYTWFFGQPEKVFSLTDTFGHDIEVEDHGAAIFHHANGMIGTFIASTVAYPGLPPTLTLQTEKGTLVVTNGRITDWHIRELANPSTDPDAPLHSGAASASVAETGGHEAIVRDFIKAVREDREPLVSGRSAMEGTILTLRIYDRL